MATTLKQVEAVPASYPGTPQDLTDKALYLDARVVWDRIEAYTVHRFTERAVSWVAEGPGEWVPPLTPATVTGTQVWFEGAGWQDVTLPASPLGGFDLPAATHYKVNATVGAGPVPAAVLEAYRRLAEYMVTQHDAPGSSSHSVDLGGMSETVDRSPTWLARAMVNSGAGDLLRPYRRAQ